MSTNFDLRLIALFVFASLFYALNVDFWALGDVYYYANIIEAEGWHDHTLHQGYYFISLAFHQLFNLFTDLQLPYSMAYMNCILAAGILVISYRLAGHFLSEERWQWLVVLVLLLSYRLWSNAIVAEVYTLQTFFLLLSFLFFLEHRYLATGLAFAFGAWTTPLSAFCALFFPTVALLRGYPFVKSLALAALPVLIFYGSFLALFYEELFWGSRGLFVVREKIGFHPDKGIRSFLLYTFKHYNFLFVLWIAAFWHFREQRNTLLITLATAIPNAYILSVLTGEDNTFILVLDFFFALWIAIGASVLWQSQKYPALTRTLMCACVMIAAAIFVKTQTPFMNSPHREYAEQMTELATRLEQEDKQLLTNWATAMAVVYYGRETPVVPFEQGEMYDRVYEEIKISLAPPEQFVDQDYVYAQETFGTSSLFDLYQSEQAIQQKLRSGSSITAFSQKFSLDCKLDTPGLVDLYRCTPVAGEPARSPQSE